MTAHIHAENMKLYAQDAAQTETPWLRWESRWPTDIHGRPGVWETCEQHLRWWDTKEYRRKPRTHKVNGFEVPEPMREAPQHGLKYWLPEPSRKDWHGWNTWDDDETDACLLERGLVHPTKEAAIANAKAMLGVSP